MIKISSIIIAKNEEQNIKRCIESQVKCINEIIVIVDERSEDKTLDIVKSFPGIKYDIIKWRGYAKTKEYAVSISSNDWIFWIDADEELTLGLSDEIIEFKSKSPEYNAYSVPRKAFFLGRWIKHSGWYPGRVTRLFNKNEVKFDGKDVHENLVVKGEVGRLINDINHYTDPDIHHYFVKFNRYTTLAAEELFNKGKTFLISDIILRPLFLFIKMFIIKRGFLDGLQGFILAVFSSAYVFTKYCKLWELKKKVRD
jgi:glycosyltransferase involved in cell wall biosynthesis